MLSQESSFIIRKMVSELQVRNKGCKLRCPIRWDDISLVVERAVEKGVHHVLLPSVNLASVDGVLELSRQYKRFFYPMIGLHPEEVKADWREQLRLIREKDCPEFVAIGEVGLDFYWSREFENEQIEAFREQVEWAVETKRPLMIHCRKAQNEMVAVLNDYRDRLCGGVFHCFTGNAREAEQLLQFPDFMLGIGGVLTFKSSRLAEMLPTVVPLLRIVLETDALYMAPEPMRGQRNESAYVRYVLKRLAESYGLSEEKASQIIYENTTRLFYLY